MPLVSFIKQISWLVKHATQAKLFIKSTKASQDRITLRLSLFDFRLSNTSISCALCRFCFAKALSPLSMVVVVMGVVVEVALLVVEVVVIVVALLVGVLGGAVLGGAVLGGGFGVGFVGWQYALYFSDTIRFCFILVVLVKLGVTVTVGGGW
jgi:hypothetical protein